MPTTNRNTDPKQALYAVAGAADLAVATIRHLPREAGKLRERFPGDAVKTYDRLVERGESLVGGIRRSRATRQATEATRAAVSRTKAATTRVRESAKTTRATAKGASTTVRRAVEADAKAVKQAAEKVGEK